MKVTNSNNEMNAGKIDKQPARNELDSATIDGATANVGGEKSDFAEVLAKVTRSHNESPNRNADRSSESQSGSRDNKTQDKDKSEPDLSAANTERPLAREPLATTPTETDSRPILHTVDIDKIVTACQVQLAANGHQEVTLELSRSMLEGLRVKVSADASGRITADFLAANEGIKSLLDNRSSELIELLRLRGINVAEFKSSVAGDANDRNQAGSEQQAGLQAERTAGGIKAVAAPGEADPMADAEGGLAAGATYRG